MSGGDNVISIKDRKRLRYGEKGYREFGEGCKHNRILLDEELLEVECEDCGAKLSGVVWMIHHMEEINRLDRSRVEYERQRFAYEMKRRSKCQHCGRISEIRPPTPAEVRMAEEVRRGERIASGDLVIVGASPASGEATNGPASLPRPEAPTSPLVPAPRSTNGDDR